jgi:thiamine-phosphate pyrophosphorylase
MPFNPTKPIIYLITDGNLTNRSVSTRSYKQTLDLITAAVSAKISLIQIREKQLSARNLYSLVQQAASITNNTETKLLVNDRADIALATNANGVHLTTVSLRTTIIRQSFPESFIIGVSTHSLAEAQTARDEGADFAVFGPVFDTISKRAYGAPVGLEKLKETTRALAPFPILALGGISLENVAKTFQCGASGIAAISLLNDASNLAEKVQAIRRDFQNKQEI